MTKPENFPYATHNSTGHKVLLKGKEHAGEIDTFQNESCYFHVGACDPNQKCSFLRMKTCFLSYFFSSKEIFSSISLIPKEIFSKRSFSAATCSLKLIAFSKSRPEVTPDLRKSSS